MQVHLSMSSKVYCLVNSLDNLTLLIAGIDGNNKLLARVRQDEMQVKNNNGGFLIFLPDSVMNNLNEIQNFVDENSNLLADNPLEFLTKIQKIVADIDKERYVNTDFHYCILKADGSYELPKYSKDGHQMN